MDQKTLANNTGAKAGHFPYWHHSGRYQTMAQGSDGTWLRQLIKIVTVAVGWRRTKHFQEVKAKRQGWMASYPWQ